MLLSEETSRNHQAERRGHIDITMMANSVITYLLPAMPAGMNKGSNEGNQ